MRMASPSIRSARRPAIERRWSVGARLSSPGGPFVTSSRMFPDLRRLFLIILRAPRTRCARSEFLEATDDERPRRARAPFLRQDRTGGSLSSGPITDDGAAENRLAFAGDFLGGNGPACLEHVREGLQGTLPAPVTGRPWRPLSNSASTLPAACAFRCDMITSGVFTASGSAGDYCG